MNEIPFVAAGNLTRDPELRSTTGGDVAHLSLAITPQRRDQSGQWQNGETTFLDASVWGTSASHAVASLHKGDRVMVFGRLVTRVLTPQTDEQPAPSVRKLEVVVDEIGPSLRWTTATLTKATAPKAHELPEEEPF